MFSHAWQHKNNKASKTIKAKVSVSKRGVWRNRIDVCIYTYIYVTEILRLEMKVGKVLASNWWVSGFTPNPAKTS